MAVDKLVDFDRNAKVLNCIGSWDIAHVSTIQYQLNQINWPAEGDITLNGKSIEKFDSAGAWIIIKLQQALAKQNLKISYVDFSEKHQHLLEIVTAKVQEEKNLSSVKKPNFLARVGKSTITQLNEFLQYLGFVGRLGIEFLRISVQPKHYRIGAVSAVVYRTGYQALPIIGLLSFMIGVVLTYQMGLQLKNYGANIFIVDLLGLSVLREFSPLITAIMVAGRTGSAFTAQLGMMKINQEIDALDTMGITPGELLLLPRIFGLFIALPLLTMWSNIFGVIGGMVMANSMLDISWYDFLERFPTVIPLKNLLIGLGKAPVFALIIASIGCFQGIKVEGSADSVGLNTTRSVVLSIFFIIVADAIFSIIFSKLKL